MYEIYTQRAGRPDSRELAGAAPTREAAIDIVRGWLNERARHEASAPIIFTHAEEIESYGGDVEEMAAALGRAAAENRHDRFNFHVVSPDGAYGEWFTTRDDAIDALETATLDAWFGWKSEYVTIKTKED